MVEVNLSAASDTDFDEAMQHAIDSRVASRIAAQDPTVWGPAAESEASKRLSWTHLAESSRPLIAEIAQLRDELNAKGLDHVVLCGMGGSSLAPEVICHAAGVDITVLDSSHPDMVRTALADRLEQTIVVASSKSGGTVETDSQRRVYERAFTEAGLDPVDHIIVVTDPGSPLDDEATKAGYRVFRADPNVGGRYSALTAFGLVPSGLAGADIDALLNDAQAVEAELALDSADNPGLQLGVLLGAANKQGVDKLVLVDQTKHGFGDWVEQLVAESTGKIGKGILPVVVPSESSTNFAPSTSDSVLVATGTTDVPHAESGWSGAITADLGAQMLLWETAVAVAGEIIGIDPFDQPDVESAKKAARELLTGSGGTESPDSSDGDIDLFGDDTGDLVGALRTLLDKADPDHGYLAVQVYLDRWDNADFAEIRETLAATLGRPVTFGWGPRFLHSTGQYHKGGTPIGVFLQITGEPAADVTIPGRDFTFGSFIASQAAGDAAVLRDHGRPVLTLHLNDVPAGLTRVTEAIA